MVARACPLRFHQRPRPVAPARGHHIGMLVVWVLTLGLEAATGWAGRGLRVGLGLSLSQAHSERPCPVVIVEVVPLAHRQTHVTRRPSLCPRGRVIMQTTRY